MELTTVPLALVIGILTPGAVAGNAGIDFEGLRSEYDGLVEIQVSVRNVTPDRIYIDAPGGDTVLIERWSLDRCVWERGVLFGCAYDRPTGTASGMAIDQNLTDLWAFELQDDASWFETETYERRPLSGRYRLKVRYSTQDWSNFFDRPEPNEFTSALSPEFEICGGR